MKRLIFLLAIMFGSFVVNGQSSSDKDVEVYEVRSISKHKSEFGSPDVTLSTEYVYDIYIYFNRKRLELEIVNTSTKKKDKIRIIKSEFIYRDTIYDGIYPSTGEECVFLFRPNSGGTYTFSISNHNIECYTLYTCVKL